MLMLTMLTIMLMMLMLWVVAMMCDDYWDHDDGDGDGKW